MKLNNLDKQVDNFNEQSEAKLMNELFGDDVLTDEQEWETYSVSEVSKELGVTLDEAKFLVNRGVFKSYRAGNEFRCHKKSVEEKKRIIEICTSYRDNKTITVMELGKILGLGKTGIYRLVNKCFFKTYVVYGKMRVDVESFEEWYAGQFHYTKVNGERPGKKYGKTIHVGTVYKVLGIPKATARDLIKRENIEMIKIDGCTRIMEDSFWKWFKSQDKYTLVKTIREVKAMSIEERVKQFNEKDCTKKSYSVDEVVMMLGVVRQTVYKLIKQGCFEAIILDGTYRIKKESFDHWLDNE